jgi:hypothetical protein
MGGDARVRTYVHALVQPTQFLVARHRVTEGPLHPTEQSSARSVLMIA